MATIKDVAREAGVSIATTSRVINNAPTPAKPPSLRLKPQWKSWAIAPMQMLGALVNKSSNAIGVLVSDVSAPFFGIMVKAIDTIASEQEKQLLVGSGYHDAEKSVTLSIC